MTDLILGPVLRHVTERTATIWMETDAACEVRCCDTTTRTFHVRGHHYALVIVDGLEPGSTTEYEVHLDGERRWPPEGRDLPPSSIRTLSPRGVEREAPLRILFGSCRTAAPHEPPWSLELATDERGRGVDALYAHARAMVERPIEEWADLVIFLGDQVYADDSSPEARKRIAARRKERPAHERLPPELVDDFEEYTWLYHESWSPKWERWLLSVVPSVMIFDDHEIIDDWNISDTWVADIHREEWWHDHIVGGLATYWLYQHLGNLDPERIREEGMLADLLAADDGFELLSRWAEEADRATPGHRRYRFSFARDVGSTKLVMVDSRMARVLVPGRRAMVDDDEWAWVQDECRADVDHLIIGTSLPAFACGAVHDAQEWNEAVIDGAWGRWPRALPQRVGEKLRRWIDMEDWSAFGRSFHALVDLIAEIGSVDRETAPASITMLSGDIHFSYHSELHFPAAQRVGARCHQVVNSPIRNALTGVEHLMMQVAISRPAAPIGRVLRRLAGRPRTDIRWGMDHGPVWANCIAELRITGRHVQVKMEQSSPADDEGTPQLDVVFIVDLA